MSLFKYLASSLTFPAIPMFGTSLQRSRRTIRGSPSSPASTDEGPLTPIIEAPAPAWRAPDARGLGVGIVEWDYFVDRLEKTEIPDPSVTFDSYASPSTLDELRWLRRAADDINTEARRTRSPAPIYPETERERERKIKRKPVPQMDEHEISTIDHTRTSSAPPNFLANPRPTNACIQPVGPRAFYANPSAAHSFVASCPNGSFRGTSPSQGGFPQRPALPRPFYSQHAGAHSVIEVSPRVPIVPPRTTSSLTDFAAYTTPPVEHEVKSTGHQRSRSGKLLRWLNRSAEV